MFLLNRFYIKDGVKLYEILDTTDMIEKNYPYDFVLNMFRTVPDLKVDGLSYKDNTLKVIPTVLQKGTSYEYASRHVLSDLNNIYCCVKTFDDIKLVHVDAYVFRKGDTKPFMILRNQPCRTKNGDFITYNFTLMSYKQHPVLIAEMSYYDKHYYREDSGETFTRTDVFFNGNNFSGQVASYGFYSDEYYDPDVELKFVSDDGTRTGYYENEIEYGVGVVHLGNDNVDLNNFL